MPYFSIRGRIILFPALVVVAAASCSGLTECGGDVLHVSSSPDDTTIAVGGEFTARLDLFGCGHNRLSDTIAFQSSGTAI